MSRLEQLLKLVELDPQDPFVHYAVALEHVNLEQWTVALVAFDRALQLDPNYTAAYFHKARAELRLGEQAQARQTLEHGMQCARSQGDGKTEREMRELMETIP